MKLVPQNGGFVIEATDLGPLLGLPPDQVQGLMAKGAITSRLEAGEGNDLGRFRVSFLYREQTLRLTVDAAGNLLSTARVTLAPQMTRR